MRNAYKILVGEREGKRLIGRPRIRWENNDNIDLKVTEFQDVNWIHVAQDRVQYGESYEHINERSVSIRGGND
jgi:hypothetical protein